MTKVLIANRGEIACRVIRACRKLGVQTVAVYSDADAAALHVALADEAVWVGEAPARLSYLQSGAILAAARTTGCDALHPGYGFLSENAAFAREVLAAGLVWIGPSPETIASMGDKQRARAIAERAGVPVLPGATRLESLAADDVARAAEQVGYPLLVKASAGGGGIGMRRVDAPSALGPALAAVSAAASRYFGDPAVYLERLVTPARHVEVQVFGDGQGDAVHLFERDCSTQRRYQKIIEEAPAPGLARHVRDKLFSSALSLARTQRYAGPGTVEFLVDVNAEEIFFLEMNTRIQVEHTVTEMITGLDLVAMQIEQAFGAWPLPPRDEISRSGHALECRICAEDPDKAFRPSTGVISRLQFPDACHDVRVDTGYRCGDAVTPHYDSLLAKVIVRADCREGARMAMIRALQATHIEGPKTNLAYLLHLMQHPRFADAALDVAWASERLQVA